MLWAHATAADDYLQATLLIHEVSYMPSIIYATQAPEEFVDQAVSKSDWYPLLEKIGAESSPMLDGEDSFPAWQYALEAHAPNAVVGKLFRGDRKSAEDGSGDPHIAYLNNSSVALVAHELGRLGREYFDDILQKSGSKNDIWLFESLSDFLTQAADQGTSIFVLWGD